MKDEKKKLTTRNGAPVVDNQNTMTAGTARPGFAVGCLVPGETGTL
jgi:catalase